MRNRMQCIAITILAACCFSAGAAEPGVYCDNIVVVLDASGSMGVPFSGSRVTKMDAAKSALKQVLLQSPRSAQIGVLVFSAKNIGTDWVYPLAPRDDARLIPAIEAPEAGSSTPLGQYMKIGADALLLQREKQFGYGSYRLLIVTDGQADDAALMQRYTQDILARGICIDVIGVDMLDDHLLAHCVHSYRRANDPATLIHAVREAFAEISDNGDGAVRSDDFALLADLPDDMAAPMIQALSESGNHPIGERPKPKTRVAVAVQTSSWETPSVVPTRHNAPIHATRESREWIVVVTFLIVATVVFGMLLRKKS